jgi:hypothetical protein
MITLPRIQPAASLLLAFAALAMHSPLLRAEPARTFGDARLSFFASERDARDGTTTDEEGVRLRLRLGAETGLSDHWLLRGRIAGRYSTEQDRSRLWLKAWTPTSTGLEDGDTTVDELFLHYAPSDGPWSVRIGRFQSKFELKGVAAKSLDRNDSPNVDVTWTDGIHMQYQWTPDWRTHLVLQSNASNGTGQATRGPLTFDSGGSSVTSYAALESTAPLGPLKQRLFAVTWMPNTLATDGVGAERREDYVTLTAKLFAEWPIGAAGMRGGLGGEAGYAPNTPAEATVGAGDGDNADGFARTFSLNLMDFAPGHHLAFVHGWTGAGWLISPDFRNNDKLLEIRYQWRFSKNWSLEARVRRREEIDLPAAATEARVDDDLYVRFSGRF